MSVSIELVALVITVLATVLGTTWKLGSMLSAVQSSLGNLDKRVDRLEPLAALAFKVDRLEYEINELRTELRRSRIASPYPPFQRPSLGSSPGDT